MWRLLVLTACLSGLAAAERKSYRSYKLISVQALNETQVKYLQSIHDTENYEVDFFSDPSLIRTTDILVAPWDYGRLNNVLRQAGFDVKVMVEDMQTLIDEEMMAMAATPLNFDYRNNYPTLDQAYLLIDDLASKYSDLITVTTLGYSHQGRALKQVKISKNTGTSKPAIWIEATTHAREWVSLSVALGIMHNLVNAHGNTEKASLDLLAAFDWYINPIHNPDGYVYTHTTDRLWRKNRQIISGCGSIVGVDLNRNWDVNHGGTGSSASCSSDTFHGGSPFSAPETAALKAAVEATPNVKAFFSFHSYSQLILLPYAYTTATAPNYNVLKTMGDNAANALYEVSKRRFTVGAAAQILYAAAGGAYDYFYVRRGIQYSFTYELRPSGLPYFELPAREIAAAIDETWASFVSFAEQIAVA
ncbi:hypothetical protein ACJMK2_024496 [Sinanodonta woodiana]|uniref:Peptidase M14 domain-containing protein n=1 Tax=Sinanodonta woodiana TaxID=1069815 RepID=A0ABD3XHD2_SINWO